MSDAGGSDKPWRDLCAVDDLGDPGAKGFEENRRRLFVVRRDGLIRAYLNVCPHRFSPLELEPDRFLNAEGDHILCTTHGALFQLDDGLCVSGPCKGSHLSPIPVDIRGGRIFIPD